MSDPTRHDSRYAGDIVEAIDTIVRYQSEHHPETELEEQIHVDAVDRQLIIVAEACGKLSAALKDRHPGIDWKAISGFRTNIVHKYWQLDRKHRRKCDHCAPGSAAKRGGFREVNLCHSGAGCVPRAGAALANASAGPSRPRRG